MSAAAGPGPAMPLRSSTLCHLAIAIAAVPVAVLVRIEIGDEPRTGSGLVDPVTAGLLLAAGQLLSFRRNRALGRPATGRADVQGIARALRRSGWSVALAICATLFVVRFLLTAPVPPLLSALFLMLIIAGVLLDLRHAGWSHRFLNDHDHPVAAFRSLPPGVGRRVRFGQSIAAASHAIYAGIATMLLIATAATEAGGAAPTTVVQIAAAAATVVVPLLHIRAVLLVRAAVVGDAVHLPAMRRAGASFVRTARVAAPLAALAVAAVPAVPAEPAVAVGRAALLCFVLGIGALQFGAVSSTHVGDFPRRWLRAAGVG